jgi:hypothetical protein
MVDIQITSISLEPNNPDVGSKIAIQNEKDAIRVFLYDCDKRICWRFKKGIKGLKKLERIKTMFDILEQQINEGIR